MILQKMVNGELVTCSEKESNEILACWKEQDSKKNAPKEKSLEDKLEELKQQVEELKAANE